MMFIQDENSPEANPLDFGNKLNLVSKDTFISNPSYKKNDEMFRFLRFNMYMPGYRIKEAEYDQLDLYNYKTKINYVKHDFRKNEQPKLFIFADSNIYHFFMDTIFHISSFAKKFPNSLIIIDYLDMLNKNLIYEKVLIDYLEENNIDYVILDKPYFLAINNFYYINITDFSDFKINSIYDVSKKYIKDINKNPTKKVYLSRKNVSKRIEDEYILEQFFKENGFEIILPENFETFEDQVSFFNEVHTLVSATSAGILNSIFMQPGGTVIELIVTKPLFDNIPGLASIHSDHFLLMSFTKKHKYIGIRTPKSGHDIINYIQNDTAFMDFILKR